MQLRLPDYFCPTKGPTLREKVLSVVQWNMRGRLVAGTWWTQRNNKEATAVESLHTGDAHCDLLEAISVAPVIPMCCVWLLLWCSPGLHEPHPFWMKLHLKMHSRSSSCAIKTIKEISVHGSRDPDKSWSEVKPQNACGVDTGTISFPGGIPPAGPHCSLFHTSPKLWVRQSTMGLVLRGV